MLNQDATSKQLYDLLLSKNLQAETLGSDGRPSTDPGDAKVFRFDYVAKSGKNYGSIVLLLDDNALAIYYSDNIGKSFEGNDRKDWFDFLQQLKQFAVKHFMSFDVRNVNRMKFDINQRDNLKESLTESWTGTKTTSYTGNPQQARLMIKHSRPLSETDRRFRLIDRLFIETVEGERFKLPFVSLTGGRAMLEHIRNGGTPYDPRGQHICSLVEELGTLARFTRASRNKIFEDETTQSLVEEARLYYEDMKKTAKKLSTASGYRNYFENWQPLDITDGDLIVEQVREMFVTQSIDERIEKALPIIARIQQEHKMKEINMFESWVNNLAEGTWALPETPEQQKKLVELMSKPLVAGPDGTNATQQLNDLFGDDSLFDAIADVADTDPDSDVRSIVIDHLQPFSRSHAGIKAVLNQINLQQGLDSNPSSAQAADVPPQDIDIDVGQEEFGPEPTPEEPAEEPPVQEAVAKNSKYKYSRDLESMLKHAGVKNPKEPEKDDGDAVVDYQVSSYDKIDESYDEELSWEDVVDMARSAMSQGNSIREILNDLTDENLIHPNEVQKLVDILRGDEMDESCGHCGYDENNELDEAEMARVSTDKPIGYRVADIGAGKKEYNVKTDREWDKQHASKDKKDEKMSEEQDTHPVTDPGLARLKTLAGFTMVK